MTRRPSLFLVLLAVGVASGILAPRTQAEGEACCSKPASRSGLLTSATPGEASKTPAPELTENFPSQRKHNLWLLTGLLAGSVALGVVSIAHWRR